MTQKYLPQTQAFVLLVPSWWYSTGKSEGGALQEEVPHWRPAFRLGKFTSLTVCSQSGDMCCQPPAIMPASYSHVSSPWWRLIALKTKVRINSSFCESLLDFVLYHSKRTVTNAHFQSCELMWFQVITFGVVDYGRPRELMQWVASVFLSSLYLQLFSVFFWLPLIFLLPPVPLLAQVHVYISSSLLPSPSCHYCAVITLGKTQVNL